MHSRMDKQNAFGDNGEMEPAAEQPEQSVEKANLPFRRKVIAALVGMSMIVIGAFAALQIYISKLKEVSSNPDLVIQKASFLLTCTAFVMGISLVVGGLYTLGLSRTIYKTKRYPPAGMPTIYDTKVFAGAQAERRALLTGLMSLLVILGGILVPVFIMFLLRGLHAVQANPLG